MIIKMYHICIYYSSIITMDTIQIIFCYYIHSIRNSIYSVPTKKSEHFNAHHCFAVRQHFSYSFCVLPFFLIKGEIELCVMKWQLLYCHYTHMYTWLGEGCVEKKVPGNATKYLVYSNQTVNHSIHAHCALWGSKEFF